MNSSLAANASTSSGNTGWEKRCKVQAIQPLVVVPATTPNSMLHTILKSIPSKFNFTIPALGGCHCAATLLPSRSALPFECSWNCLGNQTTPSTTSKGVCAVPSINTPFLFPTTPNKA
ncbi:UNVERIFIED_CONTAM: hypothetical protein Sradi_0194200 [Sesamum radiatum]|uniref:Uncharacterized protein n=1 Tax=Sesamum radiatum TaxID=300843 RepID=A0AAW2W013_SESRA